MKITTELQLREEISALATRIAELEAKLRGVLELADDLATEWEKAAKDKRQMVTLEPFASLSVVDRDTALHGAKVLAWCAAVLRERVRP